VNTSNQITLAGFTYDAAGNEKTDVTNTYIWNAESEIKTGGGVTYTYDGDGDRVQKSNGKIYWYGAGSQILDESDASGNITDEYIYFGGKRIAHHVVSTNTLTYYVEDMLGSSRALATSAGALCYDADFYPYGGEHDYTNTCSQNYKFTGKERDPETNNDDFEARYYSSAYGRFLSADWSSTPSPVPYANLTNPQTLNLYAMVSDNPESFADLDGHCPPCDVEGPPASTMEEIDEVVKPLIESASAEAGPIIGGILRGVAVGAAVVVELATSPASNANEKQLLNQANAKQAESGNSSAEPEAQAASGGKGTIYKRPSNATTQEQRDSVQGKPCSTCGATGQKNNADHIEPLVKEHYRTGTIDKAKMRSPDSVQPQCPPCSNQQGGFLSNFAKQMKKLFGGL
jgi:RHS repeat-associated protein